ncbi:hypothetical protein GALMADRAFT_84695 [Galerina marginata CBS 339.88]|uniref:Exosome complex protein n=1 Tax=Galerina marginata (strain CBS 339.88) TaxID=685588 RepID=A0A067U057_GALM3|nr:hypothetical protein GALMADRAFT_84695 [Galerina marginata CBS 339.88]
MNAETAKVKAKLAALSSSFDDLESLLEPLFAQTLPETLVGLEPLQQAKLQTVLPYVAYDLIFSVYLKSRGIDPKTHPVIPELDRIREYFEKINIAENPPAKRTEIDKAAASRFIKHAITQAQWKKTPAEEAQDDASPSTASTSTPGPAHPRATIKITQKMLERAAYEKEMKERDADAQDEDEDTLEVFNEEEDISMDVDVDPDSVTQSARPEKGKGKEVATTTSNKNKRRRPAIDPFAGYSDDPTAADAPSTSAGFKKVKPSSHSPSPSREPASNSPSKSTTPSHQPTPQPTSPEKSKSSSKKTKKKDKKAKKPTS